MTSVSSSGGLTESLLLYDIGERFDIIWHHVQPEMKEALAPFYGELVTDLMQMARKMELAAPSVDEGWETPNLNTRGDAP